MSCCTYYWKVWEWGKRFRIFARFEKIHLLNECHVTILLDKAPYITMSICVRVRTTWEYLLNIIYCYRTQFTENILTIMFMCCYKEVLLVTEVSGGLHQWGPRGSIPFCFEAVLLLTLLCKQEHREFEAVNFVWKILRRKF